MEDRTALDIAWAAGLFEGEGCWNVYNPPSRRQTGRRQPLPQMVLAMTDGDVVKRFANIAGCGHFRDVPRKRGGKAHWKAMYEWRCHRRADIKQLIELFWPYLGERRRRKAQAILDLPDAVVYADRTHCPKGHSYSGDNLVLEPIGRAGRSYYARRCKTCRQEQSRERARKRLGIDPENYRVQ